MKKIILGILVVLTVLSCKDERFVVPDETVSNEKAALFVQLLPEGQRYRMEGKENISITTSNNTNIQIPAYAFVYKDGSAIKETITIDLLEINSISNIIRCNSNSVLENGVASPKMQFEIKAMVDSKEVLLDDKKMITIRIPEQNPSSYTSLYLGIFDEDQGVKWTIDTNMDNLKLNSWETDNGLVSGYELDVHQLGWISLQTKISNLSTVSLSVELPSDFETINTAMFAIDKSNNSVIPMYYANDQHGFYSPFIPKERMIEVIAISKRGNNQYYFTNWKSELSNNESIKLNPTMVSFEELLSILAE